MSDFDYWDSAYEGGDFEHWEPVYPSPELVALVAAKMMRRNSKILDVGCGGGLDAIFLANCGFKVVAVDVSAAALRIAERRAEEAYVEVDWRQGSVLDLPIEDETVDFVTDRGLFHVIEDPDRSRYASELFRVLRPHGHAMIRGASRESAQDRFNPVTEEAIDRFFMKTRFKRGPVLPIPLYSSIGALDARIVIIEKIAKNDRMARSIGKESLKTETGEKA